MAWSWPHYTSARKTPPSCDRGFELGYNHGMDSPSPRRRFQFLRDASDRLTFEICNVGADSYLELRDEIAKAFSLLPHTSATSTYDVAFRDYELNGSIVGIEWDNWSGFLVVAKNPAAEPLVRKIAEYLGTRSWEES
jgi:hypothetical protein